MRALPEYPQTFLYLRTPMALEHADELWESLSDAWDAQQWPESIERLIPLNEGTWENGLVLGVRWMLSASEFSGALSSALAKFDAWAVINTRGEWKESVSGGPLSAYFDALPAAPSPTAQIFLGFDPIRHPEQAIDSLRNVYGRDNCLPVFHFRDGRILLLRSAQPARVIRARIADAARRIDCVSGCDAFGEPFSKDDRPIWETDSLHGLWFDSPDEGDRSD
ncbi:MAG: hypothetical protein WB676_19940 [Bryobacteraceae bacterium]